MTKYNFFSLGFTIESPHEVNKWFKKSVLVGFASPTLLVSTKQFLTLFLFASYLIAVLYLCKGIIKNKGAECIHSLLC
jgi:hypothetical protein